MECSHLAVSIGIDRNFIKQKKIDKFWQCTTCPTETKATDNWMCLKCGQVGCGRNENGHALSHYSNEFNKDHNICMNTITLSLYCYKCDDFVINDNEAPINELRSELKDDSDLLSETSSNLEEIASVKSTQEQETVSTSSCDSGLEESISGRNLRPRKRTISTDVTADNSTNNSNTSANSNKRKSTNNHIKKAVGLRNLGNTCFMNSVLQSLHNIRGFSDFFSSLPSLDQKPKRPYYSRSIKENLEDIFLVEELRKVLINLNKGADHNKTAISPECLFLVIWKVVPQFKGHRQHDAHEFLRYMLDRLHTELQYVPVAIENTPATVAGTNSKLSKNYICPPLSTNKSRGQSIVTNVFGGVLQSEVRCLICGMESKKHDPFLDLSLDIPEKYYKDVENSENKQVCHIADCLSSFTEVEELTETELYYCSVCKCKQKSTKRFWIRRLPNVLCLHIKRFRWNNFFRTKIDLRISFPIKALDMSQFVLNNGPETRRSTNSSNVYDLAAVIVHHGNGSSCGHYTSYAIHNGVWMHFNDHSVKEVTAKHVAECKPYILFYIKRGVNGQNINVNVSPPTASATNIKST